MEKWLPAYGYEKTYEISNLGRIRRISTGRILKLNRGEYLTCSLCQNGIIKVGIIHLLVLRTFVGNAIGKEGNHKNGDKHDARLENLEWVTRKENAIHARKELGKQVGSTHPNAKLDENKVREITKLFQTMKAKELAEKFGVTIHCIYAVMYRKNWKHV